MMRLDKYLSERTGMTRSESRKAITKGRVAVNGAVCRKADTQVAEDAAVAVDGTPLAGAYQKYVYIMLNKPEGVVSASRDKRDTTVVDLVAADFPRRALFPAGRLDKTSTGFVLLTDDGAFVSRRHDDCKSVFFLSLRKRLLSAAETTSDIIDKLRQTCKQRKQQPYRKHDIKYYKRSFHFLSRIVVSPPCATIL